MENTNKPGMQCAECEALLADAIDGSLHGSALAAFEAHHRSCPVCGLMVKEATEGMHWLKGLDEVEPPRHLVHNILAQTIGAIPVAKPVVAPQGEGWLGRLKGKLSPIFSPVAMPRFAMSFGMAFFSITMLLGIAGFHVSDLRKLDMSAKGISRAYYSTEARAIRYYENIRLVYEIESRVRDLRRVATPENKREEPAPKNPPKSENEQEKDRRNQNYLRDPGQPLLAASPDEQMLDQARLNRRNS